MLRAADEWVAITVARAWDHEVLPALVEGPVGDDHWATVARWVADRSGAEVVSRARLLDMAAARHGAIAPSTPVPLHLTHRWPSRAARPLDRLRVVDLSSLWAGPLVARLLRNSGATVLKVESSARPDGARAIPDFYRQLHPPDQPTVALDLSSAGGRTELIDLVEGADIVIEASRPRALAQLGTGPGRVRPRPGRVWLSITGYGRTGPGAHWIAFGDDAAVAGGLTGTSPEGDPLFCSDAVADPVTGLMGAAAVLRSLAGGGGHLIDLALAGAAAAVARDGVSLDPESP
jgi:crotonobetainyl-CoA:carnitine CoA-transferase CaiB-like acyl-CoA transferase